MSLPNDWFPCPCCDGVGGRKEAPLPDHAAIIQDIVVASQVTLSTLEKTLMLLRREQAANTIQKYNYEDEGLGGT